MFIVIFIPIILVTSYFINLQVNTIRLEASYTEKLLDATYDAMTAFELNTANEDLSTVSDSLRSILEASTNIFFNTLCTNFGVSNASKTYLQPYVPAILFTLYDGYYIYAPTNIPEICVDKYGQTVRVGDYGTQYLGTTSGASTRGRYSFSGRTFDADTHEPNGGPKVAYSSLPATVQEEYNQVLYKNQDGSYSTKLYSVSGNTQSTYYKRDYILKSYIPYTARYESGSTNVTVNYTLDNFMTIEGYIGNVYYTKSGYFIDTSLVKEIKVDGVPLTSGGGTDWLKYSDDTLNSYILDPTNHEVTVKIQGNNSGQDIIISNRDGKISGGGLPDRYWDDAQSAVQYYVDGYIFSKWLTTNLGSMSASSIKNTEYIVGDVNAAIASSSDLKNLKMSETELDNTMLHNFGTDSICMFSGSGNNPESEESDFYNHKRNVIKNSITYNMILSMVVYTEESRTVEFNMPSFKETEWDRILNNVSITTFMEGMRCGFKWYNNYAIVTSTNNEISINENEIFYVPRVKGATTTLNDIEEDIDLDQSYKIAHRIDCDELKLNGYGAISFTSKDVKYDKVLDKSGKAVYNHKVYTDYDCIVDSNYKVGKILGLTSRPDGNTDILNYLKTYSNSSGSTEQQNLWWKLRAYRIAIAKERNNLYKTTAFAENYGWSVIYFGDVDSGRKKTDQTIDLESLGISNLNQIKKLEITIEEMRVANGSGTSETPVYGIYTDTITAKIGGTPFGIPQTISTTSTSRRTIEFSDDLVGSAGNLVLETEDSRTKFTVEAIKIYYK